MNPLPPNDGFPPSAPSPREELEARLAALALGEAGEFEAEMLRARLAADPELAAHYRHIETAVLAFKNTFDDERTAAALPIIEGIPEHLSPDRAARLAKLFAADPPTRPELVEGAPARKKIARGFPAFYRAHRNLFLAAAAALLLLAVLIPVIYTVTSPLGMSKALPGGHQGEMAGAANTPSATPAKPSVQGALALVNTPAASRPRSISPPPGIIPPATSPPIPPAVALAGEFVSGGTLAVGQQMANKLITSQVMSAQELVDSVAKDAAQNGSPTAAAPAGTGYSGLAQDVIVETGETPIQSLLASSPYAPANWTAPAAPETMARAESPARDLATIAQEPTDVVDTLVTTTNGPAGFELSSPAAAEPALEAQSSPIAPLPPPPPPLLRHPRFRHLLLGLSKAAVLAEALLGVQVRARGAPAEAGAEEEAGRRAAVSAVAVAHWRAGRGQPVGRVAVVSVEDAAGVVAVLAVVAAQTDRSGTVVQSSPSGGVSVIAGQPPGGEVGGAVAFDGGVDSRSQNVNMALGDNANATLAESNTYGGATTVSGGTLTLTGSTNGLAGNIVDTTNLVFTQGAQSAFNGAINLKGGSLSLSHNTSASPNEPVTAGTDNFSGGGNAAMPVLNVSSGTLQLGSNGSVLANSNPTVSGGNFSTGTFNDRIGEVQLTGGTIAGGPTGILTSSSANDMESDSASAILGGTVGLNKTTGGTVASSGGDQQFTAGLSASGNIGGLVNVNSNPPTIGGAITFVGNYTKAGAGTLALNGNDTYTGGTTISGGEVQFGTAGILPALNSSPTSDLNTLDTNGNNVTMSTALAGVGGIIKQGSGTLTLTGNNSFIGPTANITVVGGTHSISIPLSASGVPQPPPVNAAEKSSSQLLAQNGNVTQANASTDQPINRPPNVVKFPPAIFTADNAFSTFALNVSDASYQLAWAALQNRRWPDPSSTRTEEFLNAFSYRDPAPGTGEAAAFHYDLGQNPIESGGDLLRVSYQTAAGGRDQATPLRLTILLDGSGSMTRADRVATLRAAVRALGGLLRAGDTVSLVTFARTPQVRAVSVPAERFGEIVNIMDTLVPDGGTNMEEALKTAYAIARQSFDLHAQNRVILLTDGAANLGELDPAALAGIVEENRAAGIALDAYGVGWDGYDDSTLEALTRKSDGRYAFLNGPADVNAAFAQKLAGALTPAAQDVKLQIEFNPERVVSYRLMGYNNLRLTQAQFRDNSVSAGELAAAEQGTALYNLVLNPQGAGPIGTARARYRDPGTNNFHELTWKIPYNGRPPVFDQATPSLRLAAVAGYFAEYLQQSPFAGDASPRGLLDLLRGVPEAFPNDPRPAGLVDALTTASALSGN